MATGKEPALVGSGRAGVMVKEPVWAGSGRVGVMVKEPVWAGSGWAGVMVKEPTWAGSGLAGVIMKIGLFSGAATLWLAVALAGPGLAAEGRNSAEAEKTRALSHGYAQLYRTVSGLKHLDKALYVKVESDKFEAVIEAISDYAGDLSDQLEKLAQDYPSLNLEDTGLPKVELKKRRAVVKDRLEDMAPIVGKTGVDFERTMLVSVLGPVNSMRFLAEVLHEEEKDAHRKAFLAKTKDRLDGLFHRVMTLLERDYFCAPSRK